MVCYKIIIDDLSQIRGEDIFHAEGYGGYGMECNYKANTKQYNEIKEKCFLIIKLVREIEEINRGETKCYY